MRTTRLAPLTFSFIRLEAWFGSRLVNVVENVAMSRGRSIIVYGVLTGVGILGANLVGFFEEDSPAHDVSGLELLWALAGFLLLVGALIGIVLVIRSNMRPMSERDIFEWRLLRQRGRRISDSSLRFGRKGEQSPSQYDEVTVVNQASRIVRYLWLNSGKYELFLFFEVQPASSITFHVQPQTDVGQDLSYIGCKGRFDDGSAIAEVATNFDIRQKYRGPAHYVVRITESGVLVASNEFKVLP